MARWQREEPGRVLSGCARRWEGEGTAVCRLTAQALGEQGGSMTHSQAELIGALEKAVSVEFWSLLMSIHSFDRVSPSIS